MHSQLKAWYPVTLLSDRVWTRTHRLAVYSMIGAGLVMILSGWLFNAELGIPLVVGAGVAAVIAPAVYSNLTGRREMKL